MRRPLLGTVRSATDRAARRDPNPKAARFVEGTMARASVALTTNDDPMGLVI